MIADSSQPNADAASVGELKGQAAEGLSVQLDQLFAKLQNNLAHNARVFEEKAGALLERLAEAERSLKDALGHAARDAAQRDAVHSIALSEGGCTAEDREQQQQQDAHDSAGDTTMLVL